jgi:multicomponent Na+:H+ antiporter subunit E
MNYLLWNIALAVLWMSLQGRFTSGNLLVGFVIGYATLFLCRSALPRSSYFRKVMQLANLAVYLGWHIILANLQIAWRVLNPWMHLKPAVIAVPLSAHTDAEITALANLITLTPGTLSVDVSPDRSALYVHVMDLSDRRTFTRALKQGLERRVLEVMR